MILFLTLIQSFGSSPAFAVELKDLKARIDLKKNQAPNITNLKGPVVGTCDGEDYYTQAELDGCIRNVSARAPSIYVPGTTNTPLISRPVPTTEPKQVYSMKLVSTERNL